MTTRNLTEGLAYEDLKGLVSNTISIDQYKPKIGSEEDTVVVAFSVTYEDPAKDLNSFIETGDVDHLDVEVSAGPDADGSYVLFVEFQRDYGLYEKIESLLKMIDQITSRDGTWKYKAYNVKTEKLFNEENFNDDIISSRVKYRMTYGNKNSLEEGWAKRLEEKLHKAR